MTYTVSSPEVSWDAPAERSASPSRRLLTVIAGAVVFVLGVLIGGFMVRSDAPPTPGDSSGELAALRAEVHLLTSQATQATTRSLELEQLLDAQRTLLTREQAQLRAATEREHFIRLALEQCNTDRQVCLNELQQFSRQRVGVPVTDVIRFAESMFDQQSSVLTNLANGEQAPAASDWSAPLISTVAPTQPTIAAKSNPPTAQVARPRPGEPTLAAPTPTLADPVVSAGRSATGVFFTPPQRRQQGVTFITPSTGSRVATRMNSGMRFTDASAAQAGHTLR